MSNPHNTGRLASLLATMALGALLAACGGGGDSSGGGGPGDPPGGGGPPPPPAENSNANLASLTLSAGTLDQIFVPATLSYTSTQAYPASTIRITATAQVPAASITINGDFASSGLPSQPIALAAGEVTPVAIVVTALDGTTRRTYTVDITRQSGSGFAQEAYIKASNPDGIVHNTAGAGDQFGYDIALSGDGNTLAVGAPYESSNATGINGDQSNNLNAETGAVYVFIHDGSGWSQQAYIKASNARRLDQFGFTMALSATGDTLVVGVPQEDGGVGGINGDESDASEANSGAVYVFVRSGDAWSQQAYIKAAQPIASDSFGSSVALSSSGDVLAVSTGRDATIRAVDVFTRNGVVWTQQSRIPGDTTLGYDNGFNSSIALSGDGATLAVGAASDRSSIGGINGNETDASLMHAGAVHVFIHDGSAWTRQAYIKPSNPHARAMFGERLALSANGNTLAVGVKNEPGNGTGINGDGTDASMTQAGAAYVFTRAGDDWSQQAYIKASNTGDGDAFGKSIALSADGNRLVVGAAFEDSNAIGIGGDQQNNAASDSGAAYLFQRSGDSWSQQAYIKASNTEAGDLFGWGVALSADGTRLAVSAMGEASRASGINGDQSDNTATGAGAVYFFTGVGAD